MSPESRELIQLALFDELAAVVLPQAKGKRRRFVPMRQVRRDMDDAAFTGRQRLLLRALANSDPHEMPPFVQRLCYALGLHPCPDQTTPKQWVKGNPTRTLTPQERLMRSERLTRAKAERIKEGIRFLAGLLELAGIAELNINTVEKKINWDIPTPETLIDFTELDSFFGEVENRYHALRHAQTERGSEWQ
jgi:hypothetical protein